MAENNNSNSNIFRQKSLDRVSSPEDLDKYIKTTTPSLWLLLASIIIFLVGIIVWATVGKINTESVVGCKVDGTMITCYMKEEDFNKVGDSSYISVDNNAIEIDSIEGPEQLNKDSYLLHNSGIEKGAWYYEVTGQTTLSFGEYKGKIIFEQISPIKFIIN